LGNRTDIAPVYGMLDIVVVSSRYEGCSRTILEAMAMGKPVIATATGGTPELVQDGITGVLVPPANPSALAEAIMRVIGDPEEGIRMGSCGRGRAEADFSLQRMVSRVLQVYGLCGVRERVAA
jgi:glycosyltransferase involved in cell wall biosynthesis